MLDARFLHLYFSQSLPTPQHGLSAIADLLVNSVSVVMFSSKQSLRPNLLYFLD